MVVWRREEEKRTRREETTQTPPKLHSLTVSASCPTGDTRHNASRQSISTPPSTLPHRISCITPGDPSDWDSQDLSREEDDTLQHWLYMYSDRSGEPENRSGGDRVERTPTTERVGGIPLPNQIWAETPGMHQTKPYPRSSPRASKQRRCRDTRSV